MNAARWLAAAAVAILALAAGDVASQEVRARLDRLPFAILRLARARLPAELRERVHDQEWLPELQHILKHAELFPLTGLLTGLRYAAGLLMRARTVAAELLPPDAVQAPASGGKRRWRRLSDVIRTLIWPMGQPLRVRLYLAGTAAVAAAATGAAAASTPVRAPDLELFAILLASGLAAQRFPRLGQGPIKEDLMNVWFLPTAVLLPPVYALIAPAPFMVNYHRRNPGPAYQRVFSTATLGLAFGAVSELARTTAPPAAGHVIPPGATLPGWALLIAGCELLAAAGVYALVLTAIKATKPATRILPLLASWSTARYQLTSLALGIAATFAAATNPLLVIPLIPGVILVYKHFTTDAPVPPAIR